MNNAKVPKKLSRWLMWLTIKLWLNGGKNKKNKVESLIRCRFKKRVLKNRNWPPRKFHKEIRFNLKRGGVILNIERIGRGHYELVYQQNFKRKYYLKNKESLNINAIKFKSDKPTELSEVPIGTNKRSVNRSSCSLLYDYNKFLYTKTPRVAHQTFRGK